MPTTIPIIDISGLNPTKSGWGPTAIPLDRGLLSITSLVIHHTAGGDIAGALPGLISSGFAYHYFIEKNGVVKQYVPDNYMAQHAGNMNGKSIGIALVGADEDDVISRPIQIAAAIAFANQLIDKYHPNILRSNIYGHGELPSAGKAADEGNYVASQLRGTFQRTNPGPRAGLAAGRNGNATSFAMGLGSTEDTRPRYERTSTLDTKGSSITPFIGSLESFHPNIQYELTKRRVSADTTNTYMPFAKLTALVNVLGDNVPDGLPGRPVAWCPSLGIHELDTQTFDSIYQIPQNNRSIIGYARRTRDESVVTVPVVVDTRSEGKNPPKVPIPGITQISTERGTAGPMGVRGGLTRSTINILAYSVGQVDVLLKYFLRPATRVVLEWGRNSSSPTETIKSYDWTRTADELADEFTNLIDSPDAQKKFIDDYIYANNGRYEILIGYVVKFDLKVNKSNVYEITLTVHSVQQFEVPTKHTGVKSLCAQATDNKCAAMDIQEYFDDAYSWKEKTFFKLMTRATQLKDSTTTYEWENHFIPIKNDSPVNRGAGGPSSPGAGAREAGTSETEYFVSWKFFVDKILNDETEGILSLIPDTKTRNMLKIGLLKSVKIPDTEDKKFSTDNLVANEVGYHPALRSTNASVMVINNPRAQSATEDKDYINLLNASITTAEERRDVNNDRLAKFIRENTVVGSFKNEGNRNGAGVGYLTSGVWLNTATIKQAFTANDTISSALDYLLTMMNSATEGYWNLQIYSTERPNPGMYVIDWGLSKRLTVMDRASTTPQKPIPGIDYEEMETSNVLGSVVDIDLTRYRQSEEAPDKPKYIYMFNRGTKILSDGELGSDIIDLNVEFNLPQVIAVQAIAGVGGPAQKSTLQSIDIPELNRISLIKNLFPNCEEDTNQICQEITVTSCNDNDTKNIQQRLTAAQTRLQEEQTRNTVADRTMGSSFTQFGMGLSGMNDGFGQLGNALAAWVGRRRTLQRATAAVEEIQRELAPLEVQRVFGNLNVVNTVKELSSLGTLLKFIEFNPAAMIKRMNIDSTTSELGKNSSDAHAFSSSNLTKTLVNLTVPGIGGIDLFQSFLVDRVPSILDRGFYVVTKINHKFSPEAGWTTNIEGRFRFRPLNENGGRGEVVCTGAPATGTSRVTGRVSGTESTTATQTTRQTPAARSPAARSPAPVNPRFGQLPFGTPQGNVDTGLATTRMNAAYEEARRRGAFGPRPGPLEGEVPTDQPEAQSFVVTPTGIRPSNRNRR